MMMKNRACCHNLGHLILRVGVGAGLLYHGIMKLGASEQMMGFVGWAAHKVWLTFLSTDVWFQIARAIEIGAGGALILGIFTPVAAFLGMLVLLFAANSKWWALQKAELDFAYILTLLSLTLTGGGRYSIDGRCKWRKYCKDGKCDDKAMKDGCCGDGGCC